MELTVLERLILLQILPSQGTLLTMKIVRDLQDDVGFNEDELEALSFVQGDEKMQWNSEADIPKEITVGQTAKDIVRAKLKGLDEDEKLTMQHLSLCEKFGYDGT